MQAICLIQGKQYTVSKGDQLLVDRLPQEVGDKVTFETVLSIVEKDSIKLGAPYVNKAKLEVEVEAHTKGKKIEVFKRLKRKDSKKKQGHRQHLTQLRVTGISK